MSLLSLNLREVPHAHVAATELAARARRAGLAVSLTSMPAQTPLLRYALSHSHGYTEVRVAPQQLAQACWPELAGLAWEAMAEQDWPSLFTELGQLLAHLPGIAAPCQVRWLGAQQTGLEPVAGPALQTDWGLCWLDQWQGAPVNRALPASVANLLLPLDMELALVRLKSSRLNRLAPGDVIVLEDVTARLCVGGHGLYRFVLHEDTIMMDEILEDLPFEALTGSSLMEMTEPTLPAATAGAIPEKVDVAELPVTVRVLFAQLDLTVQELADLGIGSTLPLPAGVEGAVQLQVNGRCFAVGELVRVGETLGVSLTAVGNR